MTGANEEGERVTAQTSPAAGEIQAWLVAYLGSVHGVTPADVDVTATFDRLGLDSTSAVIMTADLEDWLGEEVEPTLPYRYPTIEVLAHHLASRGNA